MALYLKCVKRIVLFIAIASNNSPSLYSQFGMSVAYSTDKALVMNVFYGKDNNSYYFGISQQSSSIKNTVVRERKWNYGLTPTGSGDYYWLLDFGYGRKFYNRIIIQPEVSIGGKNYYTNYSDRRF